MASGVDKVSQSKIELSSYSASNIKLKRHSIEGVRGKAVKSVFLTDGNKLDVYEFKEYGDKGSMARAGAYVALDIFTFGLWEIVGTPIEHSINVVDGRRYRSSVIYNNDEVVDVRLEGESEGNTMEVIKDFKNVRYRLMR